MLFDTHMHTHYSSDSKMSIKQAIARGRALGLGITITEHLEDVDYPKQEDYIFDFDKYFEDYSRYRSTEVLLGIEVGMQVQLAQEIGELLRGKPFDFVLGSIHTVDGIDVYLEEFSRGRTKREVYGEYFAAMIACLKNHNFIDSLAHIDFIARYAKFEDPELYYSEFADYIDAVLGILAEKQMAIEINTQRLGNPGAARALIPIYRRFAELGGGLVTIGSDAHRQSNIGRYFQEAMEIATACGLKPVWFKNHEPHYANSTKIRAC